jgi:hypothetical protein
MFRKFQPKCRVLELTYPLTKKTVSLLSSRDSWSRPRFKKPKAMFKKLEISPKELDKPLLLKKPKPTPKKPQMC